LSCLFYSPLTNLSSNSLVQGKYSKLPIIFLLNHKYLRYLLRVSLFLKKFQCPLLSLWCGVSFPYAGRNYHGNVPKIINNLGILISKCRKSNFTTRIGFNRLCPPLTPISNPDYSLYYLIPYITLPIPDCHTKTPTTSITIWNLAETNWLLR